MFHAHSFRPDPLLQGIVESYVFIRTEFADYHLECDIFPHVYQNISFNLGMEDGIYDIRNREFVGTNVLVGPTDTICKLRIFRGMKRLVVNLKPSGWYKLFRVPVRHFVNRSFNLEDILGKEIAAFGKRLTETDDLIQQVRMLDGFFLSYWICPGKKSSDPIDEALRQVLDSKGIITIKQLVRSVFMTSRTLERHFLEQTGLYPKMFTRIVRFSETIKLMQRSSPIEWAEFASNQGYYDQSHFINEFQFFAGCAPGRYVKQPNGFAPTLDT
jgi:AraC-like DNA-binding protein